MGKLQYGTRFNSIYNRTESKWKNRHHLGWPNQGWSRRERNGPKSIPGRKRRSREGGEVGASGREGGTWQRGRQPRAGFGRETSVARKLLASTFCSAEVGTARTGVHVGRDPPPHLTIFFFLTSFHFFFHPMPPPPPPPTVSPQAIPIFSLLW
jgi:hypothetical protein